ncbi:hypothetical protein GQ457_01G020600 [Hibiscus cannabinus]
MTPPPPIDSSRRDKFAGGPRAAVTTVVRRGEENKVSGCLKRGGSGDQIAKRRSPTCSPASEKSDWSWPSPSDHRRRSHAPPRAASASGRAPGSRLGASSLQCTLLHRITPRGCTGAAVHCSSLDPARGYTCTLPHWISSRGCTLVAVHLPAPDRWRLGPALIGR